MRILDRVSWRVVALLFVILLALSGCGGGGSPSQPAASTGTGTVTLTNLKDGQEVPCRLAIEGAYPPSVTDAIWPLVYVDGVYHPQDTPQGSGKSAVKAEGTWRGNVQFGDCAQSKGQVFQLVIVTADRGANKAFEDYLTETRKTKTYVGTLLPPGATEQARISVTRQ